MLIYWNYPKNIINPILKLNLQSSLPGIQCLIQTEFWRGLSYNYILLLFSDCPSNKFRNSTSVHRRNPSSSKTIKTHYNQIHSACPPWKINSVFICTLRKKRDSSFSLCMCLRYFINWQMPNSLTEVMRSPGGGFKRKLQSSLWETRCTLLKPWGDCVLGCLLQGIELFIY